MDKKDTKYIDLNTTLSAVGKAVFVNFFMILKMHLYQIMK